MIEAICRRLHTLDPTGLQGGRARSGVVVGIDRDPMAKVTLLLFDDRGQIAAVAKVARDPRAEKALRAEHQALRRLAGAPLTGLRRQVPAPLLLDEVAGRLVLASSSVTGAPMTVAYYTPGHVVARDRVARDFANAGAWLARLHQETAPPGVAFGDAYEEQVSPVIERYRHRLGESAWEAAAFAELASDARALADLTVPMPLLHGDYAIGNILCSAGSIAGVVDWELSRARALPLLDVLKFAASYSSFLDRAEPPRGGGMRGHPGWRSAQRRWPAPASWSNLTGFMYGFFGEGWYPDLVRAFVGEHAARLGLPAQAVHVVLRAFVVEQATVLDNPTYAEGYRALFHTLQTQHGGARRRVGPAGAR